jgi:hypothetical protein
MLTLSTFCLGSNQTMYRGGRRSTLENGSGSLEIHLIQCCLCTRVLTTTTTTTTTTNRKLVWKH